MRPLGILTLTILLQTVTVLVAADDLIRFRLKNGDQLTGELLKPTQPGHYRIRVGDQVVEVPHNDVYTTLPVEVEGEKVVAVQELQATTDLATLIGQLSGRSVRNVSPDSAEIFQGCLAAVARKEWDSALRGTRRLFEREPRWAAPQVLRCFLHSERGEVDAALETAIVLDSRFGRDPLALDVVALAYDRAGFRTLAAEVRSRAVDQQYGALQAEYRKVGIWWSIDSDQSLSYWFDYTAKDPTLSRPWCREGRALEKIELSIGLGEWDQAREQVDFLAREFPWLKARVADLERRILVARFEATEKSGRLEESFATLRSLEIVDRERASEWRARRTGLVGFILKRGLAEKELHESIRYFSEKGHFFAEEPNSRREIALHLRGLGLEQLSLGKLPNARLALAEARNWDVAAQNDESLYLPGAYERLAEDLKLGRRVRLLQTIELLIDFFPHQEETILDETAFLIRSELADRKPLSEIQHMLEEVRGLAKRRALARSKQRPEEQAEEKKKQATEELRLASRAYPTLARYFPHEPGTRWIYRTGAGELEERRVESLTPLENGGWKVAIQISAPDGDGAHAGYLLHAYLRGSDLLLLYPEAPPGEVALRFPLTADRRFSWSKGDMSFERVIRRPESALSTVLGTFDDAIVVEGRNSIHVEGVDKSYSTWKRTTYVAGLGIVRIEGEDPSIDRTLIEFYPPAPSEPPALPTGR